MLIFSWWQNFMVPTLDFIPQNLHIFNINRLLSLEKYIHSLQVFIHDYCLLYTGWQKSNRAAIFWHNFIQFRDNGIKSSLYDRELIKEQILSKIFGVPSLCSEIELKARRKILGKSSHHLGPDFLSLPDGWLQYRLKTFGLLRTDNSLKNTKRRNPSDSNTMSTVAIIETC